MVYLLLLHMCFLYSGVIRMFCPAVGVIQRCDADDATKSTREQVLPPRIPLPTLSLLLSVSSLQLNSLKTLRLALF